MELRPIRKPNYQGSKQADDNSGGDGCADGNEEIS
jgi:hypothetical protein